jgi:DNA-binding response OmpR family regulator
MAEIFNRDGRFEVRTATSGYDAGVQTQEFRPDIILLDYMLPDVNGNIVCQTIKSNPQFDEIKIIIVSGVVKQDEIDQLLRSGAEGFLKKPFDVDELLNTVCGLLQIR